jgi:hypothetical protein
LELCVIQHTQKRLVEGETEKEKEKGRKKNLGGTYHRRRNGEIETWVGKNNVDIGGCFPIRLSEVGYPLFLFTSSSLPKTKEREYLSSFPPLPPLSVRHPLERNLEGGSTMKNSHRTTQRVSESTCACAL